VFQYYLNSITSTKRDITDLFESVQLNISNPNFVIQQGKITKVIAMTPKQILMMIEETVGGNVYQGKRDKAEHELVQKERCIASTRGVRVWERPYILILCLRFS
jgi:structural maintenance of chromosome 2